MNWLDSISDSMDMNLRKLQETVKVRGTWRAAVHSHKASDTTYRLDNIMGSRPHRGVIQPSPFLASAVYGPLLPWQVVPLPLPQAGVLSSCGPHSLLHPEHGTSFTQLIPARLMAKSVPVSFLLRTSSFTLTEGQNSQLHHFEV